MRTERCDRAVQALRAAERLCAWQTAPAHTGLQTPEEVPVRMTAPVIDVHTHLLPPQYLDLLRSRSEPPMIVDRGGTEFLVHLPVPSPGPPADGPGMPVTDAFWSPDTKIAFMDEAGIDVSVLSLGNPWLDFVTPDEAVSYAASLNAEFEQTAASSGGRFFALGVVPTAAGADASSSEVDRIAEQPHMRGIILSTRGFGSGLDDPAMDAVWAKVVEHELVVFTHPHYGIGNENYSGYGVSLLISLGFTFETTVMAARLALSGVFERFPSLSLMLSHAGGTLPFLASRLDASLSINPALRDLPEPSGTLKAAILDSVVYDGDSLRRVLEFGDHDRIVFGTDHPFMIAGADRLLAALDAAAGDNQELAAAIRGANAARLYRLGLPAA